LELDLPNIIDEDIKILNYKKSFVIYDRGSFYQIGLDGNILKVLRKWFDDLVVFEDRLYLLAKNKVFEYDDHSRIFEPILELNKVMIGTSLNLIPLSDNTFIIKRDVGNMLFIDVIRGQVIKSSYEFSSEKTGDKMFLFGKKKIGNYTFLAIGSKGSDNKPVKLLKFNEGGEFLLSRRTWFLYPMEFRVDNITDNYIISYYDSRNEGILATWVYKLHDSIEEAKSVITSTVQKEFEVYKPEYSDEISYYFQRIDTCILDYNQNQNSFGQINNNDLEVNKLIGPYDDKELGGSLINFYIPLKKIYKKKYRSSHILIKSNDSSNKELKIAESILARIVNGESFESLSDSFNDDLAAASKGGDIGWFADGELVKEYEDVLKQLKIGEAGICKTIFGYHVVLKTDEKASELVGFKTKRFSKSILSEKDLVSF
jgi:parvulin-like peptidyl-prolyl isomerase